MLECHNLTRKLQSGSTELTVLKEVSLKIEASQSVAILGPSGSGKSTLLGLLAGLDQPTEGEIQFEGQSLGGMNEDQLSRLRRENIGFVFQDFQLLGHLTARENVLLPLELSGKNKPGEKADEMLAAVGLAERGHHYPSQLSGGEKQRVAIARACAGAPSLLLADEPTGNLDPATGKKVLQLLLDLQREQRMTLVLVTHDQSVADQMQRQIHLNSGEVVKDVMSQETVGVTNDSEAEQTVVQPISEDVSGQVSE